MSARINRVAFAAVSSVLLAPLTGSAQPILVKPAIVQINAPADTLFPLGAYSESINISTDGKLPFKFVRAEPAVEGTPDIDYLIVSPSSGVGPASVSVALNPNIVPYMTPGGSLIAYDRILVFALADQPSSIARVVVGLSVLSPGPPSIGAVVGSATLQPRISPGELVSIFGAHLSTPPLNGQPSNAGLYPTTLGNTMVTFNGIPAPLLYVSNNQINCVVPSGVAGQPTVDVVVVRVYVSGGNPRSPAVTLPLQNTSPGIFTADQSGTGQGAILNADPSNLYVLTLNSASNPAPKGSAIALFANGGGKWNSPSYSDGSVVFNPYQAFGVSILAPAAPVSLTIGGQPAKLLYVAAVGGQVLGMLQVNAVVPDGIGSGLQPIVLKIGGQDNSDQKVTIAIK